MRSRAPRVTVTIVLLDGLGTFHFTGFAQILKANPPCRLGGLKRTRLPQRQGQLTYRRAKRHSLCILSRHLDGHRFCRLGLATAVCNLVDGQDAHIL